MKTIKLAIFDIDGTIFRSSLLVELMNGMVEMGVFPALAKKEMEKEYLAWLNRKGEYGDYIHKVIQLHVKYIAGKSAKDVEAVAKFVVTLQKDRVYRFTRDLIKQLKKQSYHLIAISGSPTYIVSKFAKAAGFHAYFGSQYEVKNGVYTGGVLNIDSYNNKPKVLSQYLQQHGLKADLKKSIAVGDTETDISMLSLVGKPIAFNPNLGLAKYAKTHKWEVVVERKDVIYGLDKFRLAKE